MDFLQKLVTPHGDKHPRLNDDHRRLPTRPSPGEPHGDARGAHTSEHEHGEYQAYHGGPYVRSRPQRLLGALAQHKILMVVAVVLLLMVAIGGILTVALLLPLIGTLVALLEAQDLTALLADLPRLLSTLLVDVPKAVLEYLAPFLQLKSALEGKA